MVQDDLTQFDSSPKLKTIDDILKGDNFGLHLRTSREQFDRLRDYSKSPNNDDQCSPVMVKIASSPSKFEMTQSLVRHGSRDSSVSKSKDSKISVLLSSNKKIDCKTVESRDQLSDKVSKFYFQQKTGF